MTQPDDAGRAVLGAWNRIVLDRIVEWIDHRLAGSQTAPREALVTGRRLEAATWWFVGLGVLLRLARYAMNYPLWWDEAFVAVNFIRRDFLELVRPLDYGQVCPIGFLWAELI